MSTYPVEAISIETGPPDADIFELSGGNNVVLEHALAPRGTVQT
jgi:hypothetical protein